MLWGSPDGFVTGLVQKFLSVRTLSSIGCHLARGGPPLHVRTVGRPCDRFVGRWRLFFAPKNFWTAERARAMPHVPCSLSEISLLSPTAQQWASGDLPLEEMAMSVITSESTEGKSRALLDTWGLVFVVSLSLKFRSTSPFVDTTPTQCRNAVPCNCPPAAQGTCYNCRVREPTKRPSEATFSLLGDLSTSFSIQRQSVAGGLNTRNFASM